MGRGSDPLLGRVLDHRYRVDAIVARGGMATVYRAHDLRLDRVCAVKIMHPHLGDDHDFASRFVREAHSAARLSHANVVAVTDQGEDGDRLFLVMEYVEGRTLRDVIRDEAPMPPARALGLLEPVLLALTEAHRCGIVHRDIKPENVLITEGPVELVKVADFGLARVFDGDAAGHTATTGLLIGTVSYLAPEIITHGLSDPRSDVYAAGVLLFEMLTGRKPHVGDGAVQVAFKHVNEDVPTPSTVLGRPLPAYVDALVQRATARQREWRPADAKVLLHQVRRVRAAVEADETDEDLTADLLLPAARVPAEASLAEERGPDLGDGPDEEATAVIAARRASLGGWGAAAAGAAEPAVAVGPLVEPVIDPAPEQVAEPRGVRTAEVEPVGVRTAEVVPVGGTAPGSTAGPPPGPPRTREAPPPAWPVPAGPGPQGPGQGPGPLRTSARVPGAAAPARPGRRRRRLRRGPLLLVAVLALALVAGLGGWWFGLGRYTSTPGLINLSVADASAKAEGEGLSVDVAEREYSETVPAGSVMGTDPAAGGRILRGGTVELVVSRGPERYDVPRLAGQPLGEVEDLLAESNLALGEVTRAWHEKVEEGRVIGSTPGAGTALRPDSAVAVEVSKGPRPIRIPDLSGKPAERAEDRLSELGFEVEVTEEHDAEVPEGRVVSQTPSKGKGYRGDAIALVVSLGPVMVEVPDVRTQSIEDARAELQAEGFAVQVVQTDLYVGLDRVVRQSPGGGESVPEGSTITLSVV